MSGMEQLEPSMMKTRWPYQRPWSSVASPLQWGRSVSARRRSKRWKTPRGSRLRALQEAEPVKDSPLLWGRSFSGVFSLSTWRMNKWTVLTGLSSRFFKSSSPRGRRR